MAVSGPREVVRRHCGLAAELLGYGILLLVDVIAVGDVVLLVPSVLVAVVIAARRIRGVRATMMVAIVVSLAASLTSRLPVSIGLPLSVTEQVALCVGIVVVVSQVPRTDVGVPLACAAAVAVIGSPLARTVESSLGVPTYLSAAGWAVAMATGLGMREVVARRAAIVEDIRTAERMALARELHDVVAHHVTGIVVAAQAAGLVADRSRDDVDGALKEIETAGIDALAAMRTMVGVLRGREARAARAPSPGLGDVPELIRRFDPAGSLVRLTGSPGIAQAQLPAGIAATGYRVVQEALTNIRRHAPGARHVEVDMRMSGRGLLVTIHNDGVPRQPMTPLGRTGGFGLVGMAERIAALGGRFRAGRSKHGGWTVHAWLPEQGLPAVGQEQH